MSEKTLAIINWIVIIVLLVLAFGTLRFLTATGERAYGIILDMRQQQEEHHERLCNLERRSCLPL